LLKGGAYPQPLPKGKGDGFNGYKVLPSREGFRIGLHLMVHEIEDEPIERQFFTFGRQRSRIETRPLIVVDLGKYGLAKYGPSGINCKDKTNFVWS
jgi:hypothetical protein